MPALPLTESTVSEGNSIDLLACRRPGGIKEMEVGRDAKRKDRQTQRRKTN